MKHVGIRSDPKDIVSQEQLGAAPPAHEHAISDVTGLESALSGKQPTLTYKITVSSTEPVSPSVGDVWISY